LKKILGGLLLIVVVVWAAWIVCPLSVFESALERFGRGRDITIRCEGLKKGYFYRLSADRVRFERLGKTLLSLERVSAGLDPLRLFKVQVAVFVRGGVGQGIVEGYATRSQRAMQTDFTFSDVPLADVEALSNAGIRGTGRISGRASLGGHEGRISFQIADAALEPVTFEAVALPLNMFHAIRGTIDTEGPAHRIAVSLEGEHIYARLRGTVQSRVADGVIELMPERDLLENPFFLSQMERYQVSPGYYVIPVKRRFSFGP